MKLRKNILPSRWCDGFCFLLALVSMPSLFLFDILEVVPAIHAPGSFWHAFTLAVAAFLLLNIMGNWLACMLVDTSVDYAVVKPVPNTWHYCKHCKKKAPPRAWHCKICRACILKRDHHCLFTACCVGHRNQRYYIMFLFFLLIGSIYAFLYNSIYLFELKANIYRNSFSLFKILCPILLFATGSAWENIYLVLYNVNFLGMAYAVILFTYHVPPMIRGSVCYDRNSRSHDAGWKNNLRSIFGKRMHLVWLAPFVESPLPSDGTEWNNSTKNKHP